MRLSTYLQTELFTRRPAVGIEIGVCEGYNSLDLLKIFPDMTLYMVDNYPENNENKKELLLKNIEPFKDRAIYINKSSKDASLDFPDLFFDFIYIDANHSYENVLEDCRLWYPKAKEQSLIAGHDFWDKGVFDALIDFSEEARNVVYGLRHFCKNNEYIIYKQIAEYSDWFIVKDSKKQEMVANK